MKLVISPDGTITVDTPDSPSAAEFVRELYGARVAPMTGAPQAAPKAIESRRVGSKVSKPKKRARRKLAPPKADRPLTRAMDETWAWMAASDRPDGITSAEVAQAFGLTHAGGLWRINELIKRNMAWRSGPGRYRVGSLGEEPKSGQPKSGQPKSGQPKSEMNGAVSVN